MVHINNINSVILFMSYIKYCQPFTYPFYDTQDIVYNLPKTYRILQTLSNALDYFNNKKISSGNIIQDLALFVAACHTSTSIQNMDDVVSDDIRQALMTVDKRIKEVMRTNIFNGVQSRGAAKLLYEHVTYGTSTLKPLLLGILGDIDAYDFEIDAYISILMNSTEPAKKIYSACLKTLISSVSKDTANLNANERCMISEDCFDVINVESLYGVTVVYKIVFYYLGRLFKCDGNNQHPEKVLQLCRAAYREAQMIENLNYEFNTEALFMEQLILCTTAGFGEFLKPRWMNKIMSFDSFVGCTKKANDTKSVNNQDQDEKPNRCTSFSLSLGIASMSIYLKAMLETNPIFIYATF